MLSDERVKALCVEHGFVFGMRERRLVRAVEAAVREDERKAQIEKDAAIARATATGTNGVKPQTYRGDAYAKDKRSAQIDLAIRAQLEGTTDE